MAKKKDTTGGYVSSTGLVGGTPRKPPTKGKSKTTRAGEYVRDVIFDPTPAQATKASNDAANRAAKAKPRRG